MNPLLTNFISESRDLLEEASQGLLTLEKAPDDDDNLNALFRSVHTIKGGSGLFEIAPFTEVVHAAEDVLDAVRSQRLVLSPTMVDLLLDCLDQVGSWLGSLEEKEMLPEGAAAIAKKLAAQQRGLLDGSTGEEAAAESAPAPCEAGPGDPRPSWWREVPEEIRRAAEEAADAAAPWLAITYAPDPQCFFTGDDPFHTVRQLKDVRWHAVVPREPWPPLVELDPYTCNLAFHIVYDGEEETARHLFRYVEEEVSIRRIAGDGAATVDAAHVNKSTDGPKSRATAVVTEVLQAQVEMLAIPVDAKQVEGRLASVATVCTRLFAQMGWDDLADTVEAASVEAIGGRESGPLDRLLFAALERCETAPEEPPQGAPAAPTPGSVREIAETAAPPTPAAASSTPPATPPAAKTLKVDAARIDALMDLVGELVVAKNGLPFLARRAEDTYGVRDLAREIKGHHAVVNRIAEELQQAVMHVRMVPVSVAFQRFPRLVRDMSRKLGKSIHLTLSGEETEADKNVVTGLSDPLIHLVRNALDHGIELPEERTAAGKPATAEICLSATQLEDRVVIEVTDDGRGIDPARIKQTAYEKGLIDEARLDALNDEEALQLIFLPGLSTKEQASDLSGRGVGMDVVRTMVDRAGGEISLTSDLGKGTCVRLSLPLSMTVTRVMMVEMGDECFGVDIGQVVETVRIPCDAIHHVKHHEVVVLRERLIPLVRLRDALQIAPSGEEAGDNEAVLVVSVDGREVGIVVDRFHEGVDIILKPLEGVLANLPTYTGTALLGDGRVLLVLNLREIVRCP